MLLIFFILFNSFMIFTNCFLKGFAEGFGGGILVFYYIISILLKKKRSLDLVFFIFGGLFVRGRFHYYKNDLLQCSNFLGMNQNAIPHYKWSGVDVAFDKPPTKDPMGRLMV